MDNKDTNNYISKADTFYASSDEVYDVMASESADDLSAMDPIRREQLQEEWRIELAKTEEEMQTLRQVLTSKAERAQELKRKLGITVWKEFREDMEQGMKNIQDTRTFEVVKSATEKTTSVFGSIGGSVSRKLGEVKNSNAFKSFEERVGSAVTTVKSKISNSRSNSTNSFEDALNSTERKSSLNATTPITSPTIPED